jgi:phosphoglycerate dehydrogenase-like enzyme
VKNNLTVGVTTVSFSKNKELVSALESYGFDVLINEQGNRLSEVELINFLSRCDGVIVGLDKIDDKSLAKAKRLKAVSKYGVGLDNIDFNACARQGVKVLHTQGINKRSVAEMAIGFMLSLCRNLYVSSNKLKNGNWDKNGGTQLSGKTVGIIGLGNIGKEVVSLLAPFGCRILVNDLVEDSKFCETHGLIFTSKETIYAEADIITVHTPLNESTQNMINSNSFEMMKETAIVINTARGGIIDEQALYEALKTGKIAGAALDVYVTEPPVNDGLIKLPNLLCTPHIGGNSEEAVRAMGTTAITNLVEYFKEQKWL